MRVLRDVVIERTSGDELQAVSHVAGMAGEEMTLDLMGAGSTLGLRVRVIDSRPMMISGSVRHRIRLELLRVENVSRASSGAFGETPSGARAEAL